MPPGSSKSSRRYLRPSSTLRYSHYFKGAKNTTFGDHSNFSSVRGDQNVYVNAEAKKKRFIVGTEEEEAEYAEFREIKRGDIVAVRTVHRGIRRYDIKQRRWVEYGEDTVVAGEVMVEGAALKCTVVSYGGEGAEERWKRDFWRFGGARHAENAQLVAINRSKLPMHVILGDLVPVAHLWDQVGMIGQLHLSALVWQMGLWSNLWLDTSRGVFCCGPEGPEREHGIFGWMVKDLPLDAELLQEDVMLRYLISKKLDRQAVTALSYPSHHEFSRVKVDRSTAISTRTNTILAVVRTVWHAWSGFGERTELPDGVTRFTLSNRRQKQLYLSNSDGWSAWTAQASSVFYAHGVPLEGDLCEYRLILPYLSGGLMSSKAKQRIRKQFSPIYLFIPPSSTSTLWSFDLDGRIPISKDLCRYLGLPVRLRPNHWEYSGEASTYQRLRDYQAARGFDPTTTDFARQLGYPIYDVVDQPLPSRFEELDNPDTIEISSSSTQQDAASAETWPEAADFSLGILFGDAQPADEPIPVSLGLLGASTSNFAVPTQADKTKPEEQGTITTRTNMWSSLISTFSWAAMEDSDIPSAGF